MQTYHHLSQDHPHTHKEPDNNSYISGPSTPLQSPGVNWNSETLENNPFPLCPTHKHCSQPHCCSLYRRPSTRSHNPFQDLLMPILVPISGPFLPVEPCTDHMLTHLVAMDGTLQTIPTDDTQMPPEPTSPSMSTSTILSPSLSP